jgi:hypothetical protein
VEVLRGRNIYQVAFSVAVAPRPQPDPCAPIAAEVEQARAAIHAIDAEIRSLQDQLRLAAPSDKPRLRDMIAALRRERQSTEAVLADAERRLRFCRSPVLDPSP